MFKKLIWGTLIVVLLAAAAIGFRFFTSNTPFNSNHKYLYIRTGHATFAEVVKTVQDSNLVSNPGSFEWIGHRMDLDEKIKPGRYEIRKGMSLFSIARMLRNGRQSAVNLVITKLRTRADLASLIGRKFECDSASVMDYMNNKDSMSAYGFDSVSIMTAIYPNTYTYFWNNTPEGIFKKFFAEYKKVWTDERKNKAAALGLTATQAYTLASIVEEETNANEEKGNIASVYYNRYKKGMKLQADPTVKFALGDFSLRRIYEKHLLAESPYNTYRVVGLPPGPICTPQLVTLDAVLNQPATNYLFFVAKSDFSGRHTFSETYEQHLVNAKAFQKALDSVQALKKPAKEDIGTQK
ncbi:endolytic transglycosylase MltG [Pseudoflavitalea sp. G-6-1-2]|uniref:endolytic transglycosylase MltG n=1 Tax=Pseudoflavitalea sp. G-6-1-2 TaxID=2728841 RepID=UPI00146DDFED|nr:endolytic transglycosylase MltG [Pseudoflavitalea sp. G-6-1-2]NML23652.1 endolytic transglycosylase MltG [Pseudoflavitalea sp. G-6-1-2]